jgi:hypothetical protein
LPDLLPPKRRVLSDERTLASTRISYQSLHLNMVESSFNNSTDESAEDLFNMLTDCTFVALALSFNDIHDHGVRHANQHDHSFQPVSTMINSFD